MPWTQVLSLVVKGKCCIFESTQACTRQLTESLDPHPQEISAWRGIWYHLHALSADRILCVQSEVGKEAANSNGSVTDLEEVSAAFTANVWEVKCKAGQEVKKGDTLVILEAMKMEYPVTSPINGKIVEINVESNSLAQQGDVLVTIASEWSLHPIWM